MSIHGKKKLILSSVSVDLGCGGCKRPNPIANFFKPKPKKSKHYYSAVYGGGGGNNSTSSSSAKYDTATATATSFSTTPTQFSSSDDDDNVSQCLSTQVRGFGRVGGESTAVEKDSDDPYLDFRHSMLQMILEKEIYSKEELKELLHVFLELNAPYYHGVIVRAFTEIWNEVFSVRKSNRDGGGFRSRDF